MSAKSRNIFYRTAQAAAIASLLAFVGLVPSMSCVQGGADDEVAQGQESSSDAVTFDKKDAKFSLDVFIDGVGGMQVLGTSPYDPLRDGLKSVDSSTPNSLRWEIHDDDEKVLAVGYVPDPFHPEFLRDDQDELPPVQSVQFQLDVPVDHGSLVLYRNTAAPASPSEQPAFRSQQGCTPGGGSIGKAKIPSSGPGGDVAQMPGLRKIVDHGVCDGNINILIAGDGYTSSELGRFASDAQRMADALEKGTVFHKYWDHVNVWTLAVASSDSGVSSPGDSKNTVFGVEMVMSHGIGCPWVNHMSAQGSQLIYKAKKIMTAKQGGDFVQVYLTNTSKRGACGGINLKKVAITSGIAPDRGVLAHEFGHALIGLHDEYTAGTCKNESHESPNTTSHSGKLPWAYLGINSVVQGADHCTQGVYKAFSRCRMNNYHDEFCDVCARTMGRYLSRKTCTSCMGMPSMCSGDTVCSYNGPQYGYCCRKPITGSQTCSSPDECPSGQTCGKGANGKFYCLKIDSSLDCPRKSVSN